VSAFSDTRLPDGSMPQPVNPPFHLHDNDGTRDHHLPIGSGSIRFGLVRDFIAKMKEKPIITLEPHSEEDIWRTLDGFVSADFSTRCLTVRILNHYPFFCPALYIRRFLTPRTVYYSPHH
jgi:hypothetical protein